MCSSDLFSSASSTEYAIFPITGQVFNTRITKVEHDSTNNSQKSTDYYWLCTSSPMWVQVIAHDYGLGFANYSGSVGQCPTDGYSNAKTYAAYGARAADVATQITSHLSELGSGTLVTVMAGQWDILDKYNAVKANTLSQSSAESQLAASATTLADAIIQALGTGAKVVVSLTPDLSEAPLAYADGTNGKDGNFRKLVDAFNNSLYIDNLAKRVTEGGRVVAGVNPVLLTDTSTRSTSSSYVYGTAICPSVNSSSYVLKKPDGTTVTTVASGDDAYRNVKYCTTHGDLTTLVGSTSYYMWADQIHMSTLGHSLIGATGYSRSSNQF